MTNNVFEYITAVDTEIQVILLALTLYFAWFGLNYALYKVLGSDHSPYYYVLYSKVTKPSSSGITAFGLSTSVFYLIALALSIVIFTIMGRLHTEFAFRRFLLYAGVTEVAIIIINILHAKSKLGHPLINLAGWKKLGEDISKRAHEMEERKKK